MTRPAKKKKDKMLSIQRTNAVMKRVARRMKDIHYMMICQGLYFENEYDLWNLGIQPARYPGGKDTVGEIIKVSRTMHKNPVKSILYLQDENKNIKNLAMKWSEYAATILDGEE